ncbi:MAG: hypothetical protein ABIA63_04420, partial [bacterium]
MGLYCEKQKLKKLFYFVIVGILFSSINIYSIPQPTEYTMEMLKEDLGNAHFTALIEVIGVDTLGLEFTQEVSARFKVVRCYKGGIESQDSIYCSKHNPFIIGGYIPQYKIGLRSIICYTDSYKDGLNLYANGRAKFDISEDDSVAPPPTGLGFSSDFDYSRTLQAFEDLIRQTIQWEELLQYMPILATENQELFFKTSIDLSGGAALDNITLSARSSVQNVYDLVLTYTPCTGICPLLFFIKDTTVSAGKLQPGSYKIYRNEINTMINSPSGIFPPTDSVSFTVYGTAHSAGKVSIKAVDNMVKCWPNPFSGQIMFEHRASSFVHCNIAVKIYTMDGTLV